MPSARYFLQPLAVGPVDVLHRGATVDDGHRPVLAVVRERARGAVVGHVAVGVVDEGLGACRQRRMGLGRGRRRIGVGPEPVCERRLPLPEVSLAFAKAG